MVQNEVADSAAMRTQRLNDVANLVAGRKSWYDQTVFKKESHKVKRNGRGAAVTIDQLSGASEESAEAADGLVVSAPPASLQKGQSPFVLHRGEAKTGGFGAEYSNATQGIVNTLTTGRTKQTAVTIEGLTVTDQFTGGFGDAGSAVNSAAPSPYSIASTLAPPSRATYFDSLANAPTAQIYTRYLALRERMAETPGFYIDASDIMRDKGLKAEALRVLSNMAEIASEDPRLLRVLGQRLMQLGESAFAVTVFDDVKRMRGEEPQSYRDLGLAYAQAKQYQRAVDNLYQVVMRTWDSRFPEIELIAVNELNRVLRDAGSAVFHASVDPRFIKPMPFDMRVVLSWDADECDMDLWVIDPRGEKCFYSNRDTDLGGHLSRDLTGGYGPEEFLLKKAPKGKYDLKVHYYGDRQNRLSGPTTVTVDVYTHYGTPRETKKSMTVRVDGVSRVVDVGSIAIN